MLRWWKRIEQAVKGGPRRPARKNRALLTVEVLEDRRVPALVIKPTFDVSITSDPQAATIEATINESIAVMESCFSNPITVNILYEEGPGLGANLTFLDTVHLLGLPRCLGGSRNLARPTFRPGYASRRPEQSRQRQSGYAGQYSPGKGSGLTRRQRAVG